MGLPEHAKDLLVVEDDADIRETIVTILECEGYRVASAENGELALAYLREAPAPKLILLDLMMPVLDGVEFCARRENDPRLAAVPVVVVSALTASDPRVAQLRVEGRLSKPVDINRLLQVVAEHCHRS